jgi:hypothetical protein
VQFGGAMRYYLVLAVDVALLFLATAVALILRDNLEISAARFAELGPYFVSTIVMSALVIHVMRVSRVSWCFSTLPDYLRILATVSAVALATVITTFAYNRLGGVARSLPILQVILGTATLVLARIMARLHHNSQQVQTVAMKQLNAAKDQTAETVLLVGLSRLSETYLQAMAELAPGRIRVAGLVGRAEGQVGRLVAGYQVFGRPEEIERVLADLDVHGVTVDRIIVTDPFRALTREAHEALLKVERTRRIELRFLAEDLGFETNAGRSGARDVTRDVTRDVVRATTPAGPVPDTQLSFEISPAELEALAMRPHWQIKRAMDVLAAGLMILFLAPTFGGRPFKVYKFRTMAGAYGPDGRRLPDAERTSQVGTFLRRTRLDELPQLFSILRGDMSFVGPRPLLPCDQSEAYRARLLVRPGLTGWAQVIGGRTISAEDKAALDVWYVCNASLLLDLKIIARTVPMVLFGERTNEAFIKSAWDDLREAGILRGRL